MKDPRVHQELLNQFVEGADPDGPFVMVNFLRFKPGGGSKAYRKYGEAMARLVPKIGGRFRYNGRVVQRFEGDEDWHAVALVEYPSRKAFHDMLQSEEYRAIFPFRDEGLEKTLVYATQPLEI